MRDRLIILLVVIIILVAGVGLYYFTYISGPSESDLRSQDIADIPIATPANNPSQPAGDFDETGADRYIVYANGVLERTADTKRVLYFFANWCPTCIPADQAFSERENQIPQGVTLIRVNYNDPETDEEEKTLARKYGITYQHTFVQINSNGNEVTKWNGGQLTELLQNIK